MANQKLILQIDFRSGLPIYTQIVNQVQAQVVSGRLKPGDQLPTVRALAEELRVNFNTIARAYRILDEARIISTQQGRGTYITEKPPRVEALAPRDDVEVLAVDYTAVRAAFEARPELLWLIVRLLAQRLRATDEALADAVFLDVPARTAKRLLELAGDRDEFQLPMTQEDLAGLVGASRERVNKALAMFTRLGWVETTGRGHYHILDRESLEQRAEQ